MGRIPLAMTICLSLMEPVYNDPMHVNIQSGAIPTGPFCVVHTLYTEYSCDCGDRELCISHRSSVESRMMSMSGEGIVVATSFHSGQAGKRERRWCRRLVHLFKCDAVV